MFSSKVDDFNYAAKTDISQSFNSGLLTKKLSDVLLMKSKSINQSISQSMKFITPDSTVLDALNFMRDHDFTAAPIIDSAKRGRCRIIGILNLFDLVIAISHSKELDSLQSINQSLSQSSDSNQSINQSVNQPINENLAIFQLPASAVLGSSAESSYSWVFSSDQSINELLHTFSSGIHRIIVIDDAGLVSNIESNDSNIENRSYILTQMDLLTYLVNHRELLSDIVNRSLIDLHLSRHNAAFDHFHSYSSIGVRKHIDDLIDNDTPVLSEINQSINTPPRSRSGLRRASVTDSLRFCLSSDTALHAFRQMHRDRRGDVTALCIVEQSTFKLIGTISTSDFKFLTSSNLSMLGLSVIDYLKRINSDSLINQRESYLFQVTNKGSDTLFDVMKTMTVNHVHRTWLCDDIDRPVAVVSCSDVISKLSPLDQCFHQVDDGEEVREEL